MVLTAAALAAAFNTRFAQPSTIDLEAGADKSPKLPDPDFGGEKLDTVQAAGVLSFNSAGKVQTVRALSHFLVLGQIVREGELVELPDADVKRMVATGQVEIPTADQIAAAA